MAQTVRVNFGSDKFALIKKSDFTVDVASRASEFSDIDLKTVDNISFWSTNARHHIDDFVGLIKVFDRFGAKKSVYDEMYKLIEDLYIPVPDAVELLLKRVSHKILWKSRFVNEKGFKKEGSEKFYRRNLTARNYWSDTYDYIHKVHSVEDNDLVNFGGLDKSIDDRILHRAKSATPKKLLPREEFVALYKKYLGLIFDGEIWDKHNHIFTISGGFVTGLLTGDIDPESDLDIFVLRGRRNDADSFLRAIHKNMNKHFEIKMHRIGRSIQNITFGAAKSNAAKSLGVNRNEIPTNDVYRPIHMPEVQIIMSDKVNPVQLITNFDMSHIRVFLALPFHDGAPACFATSFAMLTLLSGTTYCMKSLIYPRRITKALKKNFNVGISPYTKFVYVNGGKRVYWPGQTVDLDEVSSIEQYTATKTSEAFDFTGLVPSTNLGYMNTTIRIDERHHHDPSAVIEIIEAINKCMDHRFETKKKNRHHSIHEYLDKHFSAYQKIMVYGTVDYRTPLHEKIPDYITSCRKFKTTINSFIRDEEMLSMKITKVEDIRYLNANTSNARIPRDHNGTIEKRYKWLLANRASIGEPPVPVIEVKISEYEREDPEDRIPERKIAANARDIENDDEDFAATLSDDEPVSPRRARSPSPERNVESGDGVPVRVGIPRRRM